MLPSGGLSYLGLAVSVIEPQQHPHRPGLVCQVSDTRAQPALTVESQERGLVKRIVQVYRQLPTLTRQTGVQVEETVRGQQRVESEDPLRQRAADRVGSEGVEVHAAEFLTGAGGTDSGALIVYEANSAEDAEKCKVEGRGPKGEGLSAVLEPGFEQLAGIARASLDFARAQLKVSKLSVDRIVVTGGASRPTCRRR